MDTGRSANKPISTGLVGGRNLASCLDKIAELADSFSYEDKVVVWHLRNSYGFSAREISDYLWEEDQPGEQLDVACVMDVIITMTDRYRLWQEAAQRIAMEYMNTLMAPEGRWQDSKVLH